MAQMLHLLIQLKARFGANLISQWMLRIAYKICPYNYDEQYTIFFILEKRELGPS